MNFKKIATWIAGLSAGLFFVYLALKDLNMSEIGNLLQTMQTGWIVPFVVASLLANVLRGLRWRLLFKGFKDIRRRTISAATLAGYAANVAVPRLGEVTRCGYLAKRSPVTLGEALATVVVERAIDMITLLLLLTFTLVFIIADADKAESLLGIPSTQVFQILGTLLATIAAAAAGIAVLHRNRAMFDRVKAKIEQRLPFVMKLVHLAEQIFDGLVAVKHLKQWPFFILYSVLIWAGYVAMSFFPFQSIPDATLQQLTLFDAFVVMVISSIGVVIPSPSGVGTYHFFTQKTLTLLFGVDGEVAIAYAIVVHAVMILSILGTAFMAVIFDSRKH
jgi:uncharacterized protein (TIRG00374 family)